ncbi:MAG: radical SAM family heme chaperone HemW [Alphaproteobacteria bacterium GM7ARS4]|nr:radical SAM family heme chaperone HemW [Alphaproteobacteria bacterium GM7ARS4]
MPKWRWQKSNLYPTDNAPYGSGMMPSSRDAPPMPPRDGTRQKTENAPLSIYVHWPFCEKKCPYCDFNVHLAPHPHSLDEEAILHAFIQELTCYAQSTKHKRLESIFFGGGTPSIMPYHIVSSIIATCHQLWQCSPHIEISLEANPQDHRRIRHYMAAGAQRISLGGQAYDKKRLAFLGRTHTIDDIHHSLDAILRHQGTASCDLISCLPCDTPRTWHKELSAIASLPWHHLSVYQLTIEEKTPFHKALQKKLWSPPSMAMQRRIDACTEDTLKAHGFYRYEISNYSTHRTTQCHHNKGYWQSHDYIGIGPGAHSRLTISSQDKTIRYALENHKHPRHWQRACHDKGHGRSTVYALTARQYAIEYLSMGLRLTKGIALTPLTRALNMPIYRLIRPDVVEAQQRQGFLHMTKTQGMGNAPAYHMRLSKKGFLLQDALIIDLLAETSPRHQDPQAEMSQCPYELT